MVNWPSDKLFKKFRFGNNEIIFIHFIVPSSLLLYFIVTNTRAGEQANFLAAQAPDFFSSGSGSRDQKKNGSGS